MNKAQLIDEVGKVMCSKKERGILLLTVPVLIYYYCLAKNGY